MTDCKRKRTCSRRRRRRWTRLSAARRHRLTFQCSQVRTEWFPRLGAVTGYENTVVTNVQRLWLEGSIKSFPEITNLGVEVSVRTEIWSDVAPLPGRKIDLDQSVALAYAVTDTVHRRGLKRIGYDSAELG